ncbi:hypothetical protein, partial [Planktothricoides raciborskii]|uniref:hypothetical protein n=1 Tax=Planktothricoides raciborskii TaxID=132608 RepID=UPI001A7EDD6A
KYTNILTIGVRSIPIINLGFLPKNIGRNASPLQIYKYFDYWGAKHSDNKSRLFTEKYWPECFAPTKIKNS